MHEFAVTEFAGFSLQPWKWNLFQHVASNILPNFADLKFVLVSNIVKSMAFIVVNTYYIFGLISFQFVQQTQSFSRTYWPIKMSKYHVFTPERSWMFKFILSNMSPKWSLTFYFILYRTFRCNKAFYNSLLKR